MKFSIEIVESENKIETLVDYIQSKIEEKDWHAVSDAANDIREIEERIRIYKILRQEERSRGC